MTDSEGPMAKTTKNCPECAKKGNTVAMTKKKAARPEGASSMFVADDMWVCPTCGHAEVAED